MDGWEGRGLTEFGGLSLGWEPSVIAGEGRGVLVLAREGGVSFDNRLDLVFLACEMGLTGTVICVWEATPLGPT